MQGYERAGYDRASSLKAHSPGSFITYSLKKYKLQNNNNINTFAA